MKNPNRFLFLLCLILSNISIAQVNLEDDLIAYFDKFIQPVDTDEGQKNGYFF